MKCDEIRELLSLYIDHMLDESEMKAVEEHLSACEDCRKEYNEIKEAVDLLGQTAMLPVPDAFGFRLKNALKEEKQNLVEAGNLGAGTVQKDGGKASQKKSKWRIITSVAAVFAVGVLSFGLYNDILGVLPDRLNGEVQSGAAPLEEVYDLKSADSMNAASDSAEQPVDYAAAAEPEAGSATIRMKQAVPSDENAAALSNDAQMTTSDEAGGLDPNSAMESSAADADERAGILNTEAVPDTVQNSKLALPPEECSRSTASGVEGNTAAAQFYDKLIQERLKGFDYQMLGYSYLQTGEWEFRVYIFRGNDGNTYNEEIKIIGKGGKIEIISSNELMELLNL